MEKVVTMKNFNYHAAQLFGYQLEYQLILLTKVASMCGSILYKNDAKTMRIYKQEFTSHVARIATHASQYLNNSLIFAWPYTYNGILQEIMMRRLPNPENVDEYDLKMVAIRTREQLMLTGLPNNVYQILIVRAEGNNYESFFEGTGTNCFFDKQHKGFETMMCRITFNSSSWEEQFHVEHRMYNQTFVAEKLNTTIVSEMRCVTFNNNEMTMNQTFSKLNLGTKLQVIADSLKTKIGKDILNGFSGWAITRESNHTKCPDIKLWSSPYNVLALESITALSYTNKGSFTQDCEEFRFFFFM
ncbi:hypothetical protein B9Z55_025702 [Caenorhabditis nigoni]|uniref:Uncharacterized protein n=1 Tax=Caenorhabditis nigoni TaxID=1611254 RepID=A0A2G5SZI4_9PELO|nr:hypothetical protein B9Z55_025702 [Caenorhabditis nigoni]